MKIIFTRFYAKIFFFFRQLTGAQFWQNIKSTFWRWSHIVRKNAVCCCGTIAPVTFGIWQIWLSCIDASHTWKFHTHTHTYVTLDRVYCWVWSELANAVYKSHSRFLARQIQCTMLSIDISTELNAGLCNDNELWKKKILKKLIYAFGLSFAR